MKKFEEPILECIRFGAADIIATSTQDQDNDKDNQPGDNSTKW